MKTSLHLFKLTVSEPMGARQTFSIILGSLFLTGLPGLAVEPCFYASWDESTIADHSTSSTAPLRASLVTVDPKSAHNGKGGLNVQTDGAVIAYDTRDMWPKDEGTVVFWYRPSFDVPATDSPHILVYASNKKQAAASYFIIRFEESAPPHNMLQAVSVSDNTPTFAVCKPKWQAGEWRQIAVTWDKEELVLYTDGKEAGRGDLRAPPPEIDDALHIGSLFGKQAKGDFDELRIFPKCLPPEEIQKLYNSSAKTK
ncbi:MAG: LamG domain-containing protein [Verrucomicrobia bacterium]|nr:LamG domain-containing protein [Verrucomicrobiota bacterium]